MSAPPETLLRTNAHDQYVVNFGNAGSVGVFTAEIPLPLRRGDRVVIRSPRGVEVGTVMCPATLRQARLLGATTSGPLLRPLGASDDAQLIVLHQRAERLFEAGRNRAYREGLNVELLDAEILLDGTHAILQLVADDEAVLDGFAHALEGLFDCEVRLENLAERAAEDEHGSGCDKPDCGRNAGGCTSCSTGGGCSSCGSTKVDVRDYFAHLREKMHQDQRRPLL